MVDRFSGAGEDGVAIGGRGIGGSGRGHGGGFGVVMGGGGGWIGWGGITIRSPGGTRSNDGPPPLLHSGPGICAAGAGMEIENASGAAD